MTPPGPHLAGLYRYPVKGMTPEPLQRIELTVGEGLPFDRAYAIENGPGRFDPAAPAHLPKIAFLMLMRDERLATLDARFDNDTHVLTILRAGKPVAKGDLGTRLGRTMIEQFLAAYMKSSLRGAPRIVSAPGHMFSDVATKCVHVVNMASVRELERAAGRPIDPRRFRANLVLDGLAPWVEFDWIAKPIEIAGARLRIFKRTQRCDAICVDPATATRDLNLPAELQRSWGHTDFGVYATVETAGSIAVGDAVTLPA